MALVQVLGGADLFLQGFIVSDESPGDFNAGDVRVVAVPGNHFPFALGTMETSSEAVATSAMKGKGLKLLHHYPDLLWGLGDKTTPDPSFTPMRVFPQVCSCRQLWQQDLLPAQDCPLSHSQCSWSCG